MPKTTSPGFLPLLAKHNENHGINLTFSEMNKTARRLERAFQDREDKAVEAAEFLALAYDKEYSDPTGETAVAHVMNPTECNHHDSITRRLNRSLVAA